MRHKDFSGFARAATAAALLALSAAAIGCGSPSSTGPAEPPGPDLTSIGGALVALEESYGLRIAEDALSLLSAQYRFFPVRPDSIPFLTSGQMSWDYAQETELLNLLLVEERTSWIDQVLLEIKTKQIIYDEDSTHVTVEADVQLELLIGTTDLVQSRSLMMLFYERDQAGNYILVEEREALALNPDTMLPYRELTVGELRADVLEDRGN